MNIIGHRGAAGLAPENTLAAIKAGIKAGADMLEVDVRVTKDNIPVLCHDPTLHGLRIDHQTLAELQVNSKNLTTLDNAIKLVNRKLPLILEVKPGVDIEPVISQVKRNLRTGWGAKDFSLASFDFGLLGRLHALLPEINIIVLEPWSGVRATYRAKKLGTPYICMSKRFLWWGFIASMSKRGYKLSAYTLNDPVKAKRWATYGLFGVVTDRPDEIQRLARQPH